MGDLSFFSPASATRMRSSERGSGPSANAAPGYALSMVSEFVRSRKSTRIVGTDVEDEESIVPNAPR